MTSYNTVDFDLSSFRKIWKSDTLESNIGQIENLIQDSPLLNETLRLRKASLAIIDLKAMRYLCTFGDLEAVIGWDNEIIYQEGVIFFLSKLLPMDYLGLEKMSGIMTNFVSSLESNRMTGFKSFFDFRMQGQDGSISRILQEGVALKRDSTGNIQLLLALISDISHLKRDDRQHLRLTDGRENLIYEVSNDSGVCMKLEPLSRRELEIAKLIGKKFTSEEIGEQLFLSTHTINTHRQNMLRKMRMTDMMELINFLSIYQMN
jgi:DNA-binding NarL/FixJ family response regulator